VANSTLITDYLGRGLAAARPVTPPVAAGALAIYYATDTGSLSRWTGSAWADVLTSGVGGPTWTSGTAAPASTQPVGSLYSRVGGAVGATLYVSRGAGSWLPVAGV
jgi:hypothetical protein